MATAKKASEETVITPADLEAPTTPEPPAPFEAPEDKGGAVTMADVAAINGIGLAPDASDERLVALDEAEFISEGMRLDMESQGWTLDPATGRKIERKEAE